MGQLFVRMLGPLEVLRDDAPVGIPPGRLRTLLGVLLAQSGHVVPVERLIEELWRGEVTRTAAHALQVYVSNLRKLLEPERGRGEAGQVLVTRRPGYALILPPEQCDAGRFESLLEQGCRALAEHRPAEASHLLSDARRLWRGPVLADLGDEPLITPEATRLEELRLVATERWAEAQLALGRHSELVADLESLVCEHAFRERLWRSLILALYRSGRPTDALQAYQRLRTTLAEQLGLDPSPELKRLERAVLRHDPDLDPRSARYEATMKPPELPPQLSGDASVFIGRMEERALLEGAWKRTREGAAQVVFLAGEPGIGKTKLATQLAVHAHDHGGLVLLGTCDEDLAVPYQPFVEALRYLLAVYPEAELVDALGERGGELTRLLPELSRRVPRLATPQDADPETERYLLFASVAHLLTVVCRRQPVLLLLEDLHWATKPTVLMLKHLIRAQPACSIVATYRHSDLARGHPLADLLADLRRDTAAIRLRLQGLSKREAIALMEQLAGHELSGSELELARVVHAEAEGSPFFMRELLRHFIEAGQLVQIAKQWNVQGRVAGPEIPESVREVIGRRLSRLPDHTERLLILASVIGRHFDVPVLAQLAGEEKGPVIEALDVACRAALMREVKGAPGRYIFAHALVRDTIYDELGPARRMEIHRRVAEILESLSDSHTRTSELAYHWLAATPATIVRPADTVKAARYAEQAGRDALASLAYEEAINHFTGALRAARQGLDREWICDLLILLGDAQRCAGDPAHREVLLEAGRLAAALGDADRAARAALANQRGVFSRLGAVDGERVAALEQTLEAVGPADTAVRARLLAMLGTELHFAGEQCRLELAREALDIARRIGDAPTLAQTLAARWLATWGSPLQSERRSLAAELEAVSAGLTDPTLQFNAALAVFLTASGEGDMEWADEGLARADRIADELGQPVLRWRMAYSRAHRALAAGRFDDAEHWAQEALRLGDSAAQPDHLPLSRSSMSMLRMLQGRPEEVEALVRPVLEHFPAAVVYRAALAWGRAEAGRVDEARMIVRHLRGESFGALAPDYTRLLTLSQLSRATARTQDRPVAEELYHQLLPFASAMVTAQTVWLGPVTHDLGLLAGVLGRYGDADRYFEQAVARQQRIGASGTLVHTRLEWGRLLLHQGRYVQGRALLEGAESGALQVHLPAIAARAQQLLCFS